MVVVNVKVVTVKVVTVTVGRIPSWDGLARC